MQKTAILRASAWSILAEISAKVVGPFSFLLLASLLGPSDFGTVAVGTAILGFTNVITDFGLSKIIIQQNGDAAYMEQLERACTWLNVLLGVFFCVSIIVFSGPLAVLFGQPRAAGVVAAMGLSALFFSLNSVQLSLLKKQLQFKKLFYLRLVTVGAPLFISIPLAFSGAGYWSIVAGQLSASFLVVIILWRRAFFSSFKTVNFSLLKKVMSLSAWVTIEQVFIWLLILFDTWVIGRHLSNESLGIYSISRTLFYASITLSLGAIMPVLFSYFSRISNQSVLKRDTLLAQKLSFALVGFMGMGVFMFSPLIEKVFFSSEWQGVAEVTGIIFLLMGVNYFNFPVVEALRSRGLFRQLALINVIAISISLPVLYYTSFSGLITYVWVRCALLFLAYPLVFYHSKRQLGISFSDCLWNSKNTLVSLGLLSLYQLLTGVLQLNQIIIYSLSLIVFLITLLVNLNLEKDVVKKIFSFKT